MASQAAHPGTHHPRILRLDEVMLRLGCGRSTVYRLGKAGILPQAEPIEGCSSAGWLEDDVDALVESRRPAVKKPAMPAGSAPAKATHLFGSLTKNLPPAAPSGPPSALTISATGGAWVCLRSGTWHGSRSNSRVLGKSKWKGTDKCRHR